MSKLINGLPPGYAESKKNGLVNSLPPGYAESKASGGLVNGLPPGYTPPDITRKKYYRENDNYDANVPQWMRKVDQGLLKADRYLQGKPLQTEIASRIKNPVGSFAMSVPESVWNKGGEILETLRGYGQANSAEGLTAEYQAKRMAQGARLALEIAALRGGGSTLKSLGKEAMMRPGTLQLMKHGAIKALPQGIGYGAGFGFTGAIENDLPIVEETIKGAGVGALASAVLGGVTPAIGAGVGKMMGKVKAYADGGSPKAMALAAEARRARLSPNWNREPGTVLTKGMIEDVVANGTKVASEPKSLFQKGMDYLFTSGETIGRRMGDTGNMVIDAFQETSYQQTAIKGRLQTLAKKYINPITDEQAQKRIIAALRDPKKGLASLADKDEQMAFRAFDVIRKQVFRRMEKNKADFVDAGGNAIPWTRQKPDEYFPNLHTDKMMGSEGYKAYIIKMNIDAGKSLAEAELAYRHLRELAPIRKSRSLDYERDMSLDFPGSSDLRWVTDTYIKDVSRRIPEIELLGKNREKIAPLFNDLVGQGHDISALTKMLDNLYSAKADTPIRNMFLQLNSSTKLSLGFFINTTQQTNIINSNGFNAWAKVYKDWLLHPELRAHMKDLAYSSDAFEQLMMTAESGTNPWKITNFALGLFKKSEELNRFVAANAGANYARDLSSQISKRGLSYSQLMADPSRSTQKVIRRLQSLGLDMRKIVGNKGILDSDDILRAGYRNIITTQFKIDPLSIPASWLSDNGKLISQFKSFSFMQTKYVRDEIMKEAMHGNIAPLARYMMTAPIAYWVASALKDNVTFREGSMTREFWDGEPNPKGEQSGFTTLAQKMMGTQSQDAIIKKNQDDRLQSDLLRMTGTLPADIYSNAKYFSEVSQNQYKGNLEKAGVLASAMFGPTVGEGFGLINAFNQSDAIKKENLRERPENKIDPYYYPFGRLLAPKIPYIGPTIKNTMFGEYPLRQREEFKQSIEALAKAGSYDMIDEIMNSPGITKNQRSVIKDIIRAQQISNLPQAEQDNYNNLRLRRIENNYLPIQR